MGNLFTILSLTISVRGLKRAAAWMMLIFLFTGIQFTDGQQVIPVNRQVKWKGAGIPTTNPVITKQVNVKTFGAKGDSINDDYSAINSAITSLGGHAGIVYFPPGKYLVKSTLNLPD